MNDLPKGYATATHAVLFQDEPSARCDVCASEVRGDEEDVEQGPSSGRGLLLWTRGEERRYQEAPLCPTCAAAIGMNALSRWEIEEEEG